MTRFWEFFFFPGSEAWYHGAVWGNVVAELPLAILAGCGFVYHHYALRSLHKAHDVHLKRILDALDPESDTDTQLDRITDLVDETKPGGITVVLDELRAGRRLPSADSIESKES